MFDTSYEKLDETIKDICNNVKNNLSFIKKLNEETIYEIKHILIKDYSSFYFEENNISDDFFGFEWVGNRILHTIQKETGVDMGFCKYFVPNYEKRGKEVLGSKLDSMESMNMCNISGEKQYAICRGLEHLMYCRFIEEKNNTCN